MQATGGCWGYFFSCFCCWYLLKWVWMVMAALSEGSVLSLLASGLVSPGGATGHHSEHRECQQP